MADTIDFVRAQKEKLREHLRNTLDFLEKVPLTDKALGFETMQLAMLMLAGMQTCDEVMSALRVENRALVKESLVELDMLQQLVKETIDDAKALTEVH